MEVCADGRSPWNPRGVHAPAGSLLFLHSTHVMACAVCRVRSLCAMDYNAGGWRCICCVANTIATAWCSSSMLCGGIYGSFPSLHMGHSMIRRCIQLCISRGYTICTHILVLISAGAKAQASVSSGQARQTTPAGEGGNDCGEKAQCNETLPKALQKAIPTAPQAVLLRAFPMRCNFPASRLREGNTLQPSLHMPTTVQPYFNTAH